MILAVVYFIAGGLIALLIFVKKTKIEIPESKEFEQIEREIKEWLEIPFTPTRTGIKMTTSFDAGLKPYALEKPKIAIPTERADGEHINEQVV